MDSRLVAIAYSDEQDSTQDVMGQVTDSTGVEVVIDEDGLLSATEPKRAKKDDTLGRC